MTPLELAAMVDRLNPDDDEARYLVPALMAENQRIRRELETLRADVKYMKPLPERITKILNGGNQ